MDLFGKGLRREITIVIGFLNISLANASPLTDAIQSEFEKGNLDSLTAKLLEHRFTYYMSQSFIAKCNQQSCNPEIITQHAINLAKSERRNISKSRVISLGFRNAGEAILVGIMSNAIYNAFKDPITERARATKDNWKRERDNERHRIRYRERENERRKRERDRERERNALIKANRY
jgi:hypothetical protein